MMKQNSESLSFLQSFYRNDRSYVLIFERSGKLLWQNRSHPVLKEQDFRKMLQVPPPLHGDDYEFCHENHIYHYHLSISDVHSLFILSIAPTTTPLSELYELRERHTRAVLSSMMNTIQQIHTITETHLEQPELLREPLYEQLNLLSNCCCMQLKSALLEQELQKYSDAMALEAQCFDLVKFLHDFQKKLQEEIGSDIRFTLDSAPAMVGVYANPFRLFRLLLVLCSLTLPDKAALSAMETTPCIVLQVTMTEPEAVSLLLSLSDCTAPSRGILSEAKNEYIEASLLLSCFCEQYQCKGMSFSPDSHHLQFSMQFPAIPNAGFFSLHADNHFVQENMLISEEKAMLSDNIRFSFLPAFS